MKLATLAVLTVFGLQSATLVQINAGSATDSNFVGGSKYTQTDLQTQQEPYRAMRYGPSFGYSIPVTAGKLKVTLGFIEPRNTTSSPAIGTGQRVFSVSVNGTVVIPSLDLYVVAGSQIPYSTTFDITQEAGPLSIQIQAASGKLAALLSLVKVEGIPPTEDTDTVISVRSGTLTVGQELVQDGPSMEIPVMTNIPGVRRYEMVTLCATTRFLGQTRVQMSMGRPGTNHLDLTGAFVPMENESDNSNCWTARPSIPQLIGPYDIVVYVEVFTTDGNGVEIPGNINNLTQGVMTWEISYFTGKIGNLLASARSVDKVDIFTCSGSYSRVDPNTGKTLVNDCAGMKWVVRPGVSIVGVEMKPLSALPGTEKWTLGR